MISIDSFYEKKRETEYYLDEVNKITSFLTMANNPYSSYVSNLLKNKNFNTSDFLVILKSNAFLMIYNLIESTIKNMLTELYDHINQADLTYSDINEQLQNLWRNRQYSNLENQTALPDSYKKIANKMISDVLTPQKLNFDIKQVKISGNIDSKTIGMLMRDHGIDVNTANVYSHEEEFQNIKRKRNALAHGSESFISAARNNTVQDIINIELDVTDCLENLKKDINKYIHYKRYSNHN